MMQQGKMDNPSLYKDMLLLWQTELYCTFFLQDKQQ